MYERPPPVEPDRSWAIRYLAVLPLAVATCSGCVLLPLLMMALTRVDEGEGWFQLPQRFVVVGVISLITLLSSLGVWHSLRRRWNQQLGLGFAIVSLIGFVGLLYGASRL
jgi:hypothetical protein